MPVGVRIPRDAVNAGDKSVANIDYQEAVQVLRRHVGVQYGGTESDGRNVMADVLQRELGYSSTQANDAIDAMLRASVLRYHPPGENDRDAPASPVARDAGTTPFAVGSTGEYNPGPVVVGSGYWQIGTDDEDAPGRAGQVTPA